MKTGFAPCTWNAASASLDYVSSGIKPGLVSAAALIPGTKMLQHNQLSSLGCEVLWLGDGRERMPPETRSTHAFGILTTLPVSSGKWKKGEGLRGQECGGLCGTWSCFGTTPCQMTPGGVCTGMLHYPHKSCHPPLAHC